MFVFIFFVIAIVSSTYSVLIFAENDMPIKEVIPNESLEQVIKNLNGPGLIHSIPELDPEKVILGKELIHTGHTTYNGKKSKQISRYFVCTDCHNVAREFVDLTNLSPEERFDYVKDNRLPFVQASSFWGIYNRSSFFNGDYAKQYGDVIANTHDTLENAIQACSKYCASGRWLKDWELDAIMHYFKEIELHIGDLDLPEQVLEDVINYQNLNEDGTLTLLTEIQNSYPHLFEATLVPTLALKDRKYGEGGDPEKGKLLYEISCLHCHKNERVASLDLDHDKLSGKMFWKNIQKFNNKSLYQIIRNGTYAADGKKSYMPLFTKEKMSDNQINDIAAYIKQIAGK